MNKYQDIEELLRRISSEDRIKCLKVASALKNEFGQAGYGLFHEFCEKAENYEEAWVKANWKSADEQQATIGLLYHFANRINDVDHCSQRGELFGKSLSPSKTADRAVYAQKIWEGACPDESLVIEHPYVVKKELDWATPARRARVSGSQVGREADCLVVPVHNVKTKELQSVQCINAEGTKQNFGPVKGGALILGNCELTDAVWAIAEGWASAAACIEWHGFQVAVCSFGKHALEGVANDIADVYSPLEIRLLMEDDS